MQLALALIWNLVWKNSAYYQTLQKAASNCPTGGHIGLLGASLCVRKMLDRAQSIPQRPLAMLLTPENRHAYARVSNYVLTARVACAQTATPFVAGNPLPMSNQIREVDGKSETLPNYLAWIFANVGKFQHHGQVKMLCLCYLMMRNSTYEPSWVEIRY